MAATIALACDEIDLFLRENFSKLSRPRRKSSGLPRFYLNQKAGQESGGIQTTAKGIRT
jgi:hypothetical protein